MNITISTVDGDGRDDAVATCTWAEFQAANPDLTAGEFADLADRLARDGVAYYGGGAATLFRLRRNEAK